MLSGGEKPKSVAQNAPFPNSKRITLYYIHTAFTRPLVENLLLQKKDGDTHTHTYVYNIIPTIFS